MYRIFSELIEDVILPPPGMKRRGREAKSGEFAIEKEEKEDTGVACRGQRSDAEVIGAENDGILDQV